MLSGPGNKIRQLMIALLMCMLLAGKTNSKSENITRSSQKTEILTTLSNLFSDASRPTPPSSSGTTASSKTVRAIVCHLFCQFSVVLLR